VKRTLVRAAIFAALVAAGAIAVGLANRRATVDGPRRLAWVADAHQLGPVAYRDPAGAISPDGSSIAYSEGRFLRVRSIDGGPVVDLPPGDAQIRSAIWSADGRFVIADGQPNGAPVIYDIAARKRGLLWADRETFHARFDGTGGETTARVADLRQLAWSPASPFIAAIVNARDGQELWTIAADGSSATAKKLSMRVSAPAWTPRGEIACVATENGASRVTIPCGGRAVNVDPPLNVYGPIAFAQERDLIYASAANSSGTVDLWSFPSTGGRATQLTSFSRDSYAPSVARDGRVLFKVQSYRTVVAIADAAGGATRPLARFMSETPSWHPGGRQIGITYGAWRRVPDDAKYPDIAQDTGVIDVQDAPADRVKMVVHASGSEDQSLCWSPNGKWIAFHSHKDQSDDIWLRSAQGEQAQATRISFLGRGAEVGWPRWSPDGRWILFTGARRDTRRVGLFAVGVDQESGRVTAESAPIDLNHVGTDVFHAEWLPDSAHLVVLVKEAPGRHVILTAGRDGRDVRIVHRMASEHDTPGLGVSPDGRDVAFIAPADDGFFQVFRMPLTGGPAVQVTSDRSNKTQPAWSPDGARIAFTVWNYDAQFWRLE
jgi:Tol biopolymer transport system component